MESITVDWLIDCGACSGQIEIVRSEWGTGEILLNNKNLWRAADLNLDLSWLAKQILSKDIWKEYGDQHSKICNERARRIEEIADEYATRRAKIVAKYLFAKYTRRLYKTQWNELRRERKNKINKAWEEYRHKHAILLVEMIKKEAVNK